ncbi:MAG: hypothetical protein KDD34_07385 [Bdellovibrionales bacterium]|nr:hypothetical protein [Bdellovibrionales bacterium]
MNLLLADTRPFFDACPRCGSRALEKLRTHSHCIECNYFETSESDPIESLMVDLNQEIEQLDAHTKQEKKQRLDKIQAA